MPLDLELFIAEARPPTPPARPCPRRSILGCALIDWHFGMWRSAAFSLKRRPQWGQGVRDGSGPAGAAGAPGFRAARIAARKCSLFDFQFADLAEDEGALFPVVEEFERPDDATPPARPFRTAPLPPEPR